MGKRQTSASLLWLCAMVLASGLVCIATLVHADQRGIAVVRIRDAQGHEVGLYKGSYALVVGVSHYTDGWPNLPGVAKDVRAVKAGLERAGFNVKVVRDPTHQQLDDAIGHFISRRGLQPDNRLLFYFAGHGYTLKPAYGGEPLGYFVPANAPLPDADKAGFLDTAMSMEEVQVFARQIQSKHALFLFDSCFSGTIFNSTRGIPEAIQQSTALPVREFITAGTAGQTVPDQSIFRPQFLAGIAGAADLNHDGYVTGSELGMFLADTVTNYTHGAETPKYGKLMNPYLDKGDFVFALPKTVAFTAPPSLPSSSAFNLSDIAGAARKQEAARKAWTGKLAQMKQAAQQVEALDAQDITPDLKVAAWKRFQAAFGQDDPYSSDDDALRAKAAERLAYWQGEQRRLAQEKQRRQQQAAISTQPSSRTFRDATTGMEFVYIPGGTFTQGCVVDQSPCGSDEKPTRQVTLRSFWLGKTEVSQRQWTRVMGTNPSHFKGDNRPVEEVNWNDAQAFIRHLNAQSGQHYRLPTEAEWEYACRAGGKNLEYGTRTGDLDPSLANYGSDIGHTTAVRNYPPNALGLYDMSGNVWQWVQDVYDPNAYSSGAVTDPVNERSGDFRVVRGGGWNGPPRFVRCSYRYWFGAGDSGDFLGFRLARSP